MPVSGWIGDRGPGGAGLLMALIAVPPGSAPALFAEDRLSGYSVACTIAWGWRAGPRCPPGSSRSSGFAPAPGIYPAAMAAALLSMKDRSREPLR